MKGGASLGAKGVMPDSGWSNAEIFQHYLKEHLLPYVKGQTKEDPVLLIYNGHASHVSSKLIQCAKSNNVILSVLSADTSYRLQHLHVVNLGHSNDLEERILHKIERTYNIRKQHTQFIESVHEN